MNTNSSTDLASFKDIFKSLLLKRDNNIYNEKIYTYICNKVTESIKTNQLLLITDQDHLKLNNEYISILFEAFKLSNYQYPSYIDLSYNHIQTFEFLPILMKNL